MGEAKVSLTFPAMTATRGDPTTHTTRGRGTAIAAAVIGVVALVLGLTPWFGLLPLALAATAVALGVAARDGR